MRAPRKQALAIFGGVLAVYLLFASYTNDVSVDAHASSIQAWQVGTAHTLFLDSVDPEQLLKVNGQWNKFIAYLDGELVAARTPGSWLAAVPFYVLLGQAGSYSIVPAAIAASTVAALAVMLMYLALYRLVTPSMAMAGALAFAFATPTWSVSADALWSHAVTQAALAGAALAAAKNRWDLAGVALGIGILARPHILVVALVLAAGVSWNRRSWRPAQGLALGSMAGLVVLIALNTAAFGRPSIGGAYGSIVARLAQTVEAGVGDYVVNVVGFLASPGRGVLAITPVLLLAVPLLLRAARSSPPWTVWLAIGGGAYTVAQLAANGFQGGEQFAAYRHGLELMTCLVPLSVVAVSVAGRRAQAAALGLCVGLTGVTMLGALGISWVPAAAVWRSTDVLQGFDREPLVASVIVGVAAVAAVSATVWRWRRPDVIDEPAVLEPQRAMHDD